MTAANGDMLFLDAEGYVLQTDLTKVVWNFTLTGGTGRFEGATGSFNAHIQLAAAVGSISPNPYVARLKGTISTRDEDCRTGDQEDDREGHSFVIRASSFVIIPQIVRVSRSDFIFTDGASSANPAR